jgi:hypothetical protein
MPNVDDHPVSAEFRRKSDTLYGSVVRTLRLGSSLRMEAAMAETVDGNRSGRKQPGPGQVRARAGSGPVRNQVDP